MYSANYPPLICHLKSLLITWKRHPIFWFGRVAAIKMTWPAKLMHHFRVLPVPIPTHILHALQRGVNSFIWNYCKPRIAASATYHSRCKGGLSCQISYPTIKQPNLHISRNIIQRRRYNYGWAWKHQKCPHCESIISRG